MAYRITNACLGCGGCKVVCPTEAISGPPDQVHAIDAGRCSECGLCARSCTQKAIVDSTGQPYQSKIIRQDVRD